MFSLIYSNINYISVHAKELKLNEIERERER